MIPAVAPADRDGGYASVVVLSLCVVLALLGAVGVAGGSVAVARHRAAAAADAAALAAARALEGEVVACRAAAEVSRAQGGRVLHCALGSDDVAEVLVAVRPDGPAARLGQSRVRARAGPA